jgi:hypothetical protein
MNEIWCKSYRPTTESVLWLQIPDSIADECAEMDSLDDAIDYIGNQTAWQFLPMKFFVINSEKQLEILMETEV